MKYSKLRSLQQEIKQKQVMVAQEKVTKLETAIRQEKEKKRVNVIRGAERESLVTADLLRRGFEVFRAVGSFSVDLIAYKHNALLRIEVKGSNRCAPKGPVCGSPSDTKHGSCNRFDVLAFVCNGEVSYNRSVLHTANEASMELISDNDTHSNRRTHKNQRHAEMVLKLYTETIQ